tara:strand:- start:66728 stop:68623 length:1896 start_codon:yes stop_codon:yes gene_type:complete
METSRLASLQLEVPRLADAADRVLDQLSAAVYTTDSAGVITYYNRAAAELWGDKPVIGSAHWCGSFRIYEQDGRVLPHDACPMAICLKSGKGIASAEIVVERPNGEMRNVMVSPQPIFNEAGTLIGAVNTLTDVTALRTTQEQQHSSASLVGSILDFSNDCIKILALDGSLKSINPCGCRSLEVDDPGQALGLSYFDFWQREDGKLARKAAAEALKSGESAFVGTYTSSSGKITIWDERISVINDAAGVPKGFVVISRDVTGELREAERKSKQLKQQKSLTEIGALALRNDPFEDFMAATVALMADALAVPMVKILGFSDQAEHLTLLAGVGWHDGLVGAAQVGIDQESQAGYTLLADAPVVVTDLSTETRFSGPPLLFEHGVVSGLSVIIPGIKSRAFGVLGVHDAVAHEFTESDVDYVVSVANLIASCHRLQDATQNQFLLTREIAHRAGNLLQMVNSIFNHTVRASADLGEAKSKFEKRLAHMSRSNMLVSGDGWTKTQVRALVETTLEPFLAILDMAGRDVLLSADLSFDLGLVLHELATNSAKYGAFTGDGGRVAVSWTVTKGSNGDREFCLVWCDHKQVEATKCAGTGFGTKLIHQLIERKWSGHIETVLEPNFTCTIRLPLQDG